MKHYPKNPRQITKEQFADLRDSLRKFGDLSGIVHNLNTDEVIGGNQRMEVFDLNKCQIEIVNRLDKPDEQGTVATGWVVWEGKRYTYRAVMWDERQAAEANIRANKAGGTWDWDTLANEFEIPDLLDWGFSEKELQLGGFDLNEPEGDDPGAQMDKAEELTQKWGVQSGQLWRLGEHRLICGDCTDRAVVERVMAGEKAAITFTSPPYNAGVSAQLSGNTSIDDNLYKDEYDDNQTQDEYLILLDKFTTEAINASCYVFVNIQILSGNKRAFVDYLMTYRDKLADIAIWDKGHAAPELAQRVMDSRFEFILIFSENASRAIGTRDFRGMVHNVYAGNPQRHNEFASSHAATFPIDFPEYFISNFTNRNETIYEPFNGTGTTLIACERLHRKCRAIEISPAYCAVAIQRWVDMTSGTPELLDSLH